MTEREGFPDGRMQKLIGKPWSSWNLPDQPTDFDLKRLRDQFSPPEQYRDKQSTPLSSHHKLLYGTHPDSDFLSISKCPACGWLLKIQHANKHFIRDSKGAIVCKDSELAIFGTKVLGKASYPVGELKDTYNRKITLRSLPPQPQPLASKLSYPLRGVPLLNEISSKSSSRSGSHSSSKTDYLSSSHSYSRSRSHATPSTNSYSSSKSSSRSSGGGNSSSSHHGSSSLNSSSSSGKGKSSSSKSHSSSSSSWSSLRSNSSSNKSGSSHHKSNQGSYTLSIPSEDMGQNESVEDLLMANTSHSYTNSKHTVHIIATSNSSKSKSSASSNNDQDYDHHHNKYYSDVPEKRMKLDSSSSHSRGDRDHYHHKTSSSSSHRSSADSHISHNHDLFGNSNSSKSKSKFSSSSSSLVNGNTSSHSSSDKSKSKSSSSGSSSFSSSHTKNDSGSPSKHHLRSTSSSTAVTPSKPVVSISSYSSSHSSSFSSSHSRNDSHSGSSSLTKSSSNSTDRDNKDRDKDKSSAKKKKRKRDKDEPRKIIPLKDRDFNPDKHCGVCVQGNSVPCKRSLTCKTHSMALRRAVTGRSQSFDALLAAHKLAKTEEKKLQTKEVVEEIAPPKQKKKKLSGSSNNAVTGSSPNDIGTLVGAVEPTSYAQSKSPELEIIAVKPQKPNKPQRIADLVPTNKYKLIKQCPLVYPYTPHIQEKFEEVWYNPLKMETDTKMTADEKDKFWFLLEHYKNPYFANGNVRPVPPKTPREKRNVFSQWNPSENSSQGNHHQMNWLTTMDSKRRLADPNSGEVEFLGNVIKKNQKNSSGI